MADQRLPDSGEPASGGPNRRKPSFSVAQARRNLREAERILRLYEKENRQGEALRDAKKAVREAKRDLESVTSGSREERREARQEFMEDYYNELGGPWVAELVKRDPELRRIFQKAIRTDDLAGFMDDVYQSKWWNDPDKSSSWKAAFQLEFAKDKTAWNQSIDDAKLAIRQMAKSLYGMDVPDDVLERVARKYIYEGWERMDGRGLRVWLSERLGRQEARDSDLTPGGELLDMERGLRQAARDYGVPRDDAWIAKTARDILNPDSNFSQDEAWNELIAEAESLFPVFAGKLSKDRSVRDLGAGYINQLYRYLELDSPDSVELSDSLLQRAFTNVGDDGNPSLMPLWRFNQEIKKDDRWQYTTNALSTYSQIGSDLARMMGFVG